MEFKELEEKWNDTLYSSYAKSCCFAAIAQLKGIRRQDKEREYAYSYVRDYINKNVCLTTDKELTPLDIIIAMRKKSISCAKIAKYLNDNNYKTKNNYVFNYKYVSNLFNKNLKKDKNNE